MSGLTRGRVGNGEFVPEPGPTSSILHFTAYYLNLTPTTQAKQALPGNNASGKNGNLFRVPLTRSNKKTAVAIGGFSQLRIGTAHVASAIPLSGRATSSEAKFLSWPLPLLPVPDPSAWPATKSPHLTLTPSNVKKDCAPSIDGHHTRPRGAASWRLLHCSFRLIHPRGQRFPISSKQLAQGRMQTRHSGEVGPRGTSCASTLKAWSPRSKKDDASVYTIVSFHGASTTPRARNSASWLARFNPDPFAAAKPTRLHGFSRSRSPDPTFRAFLLIRNISY